MYIKSVKFHELMNLLHKNRIKQCLVVREDKGVPIFFLGQNGKNWDHLLLLKALFYILYRFYAAMN